MAALTAKGMEGIPFSGQDGDHAAVDRIAKGLQTVSGWKNARELGKAAAWWARAKPPMSPRIRCSASSSSVSCRRKGPPRTPLHSIETVSPACRIFVHI